MKIRKFMQSFRLMTVIAAAAGFVACQENTVDTQGEILPKLATDAQNTYVADPTLPENITFNVSSNTPWRITVDCGEGFAERPWCSVSPSLSAVSSLVEEVTIKMKDNPTYESRTAAITIEADGIAEPTVITVRQTGQGNLTLSELQPREEISKDGGSASFTVVSNRDWTAESDQKWLTLDKSSGTASDDPITVTVTASVSDGLRRTAVVTVRTDLETETIEVVQEGWRMEFRPLENPETELFFGYAGDTKTYYVDANVEWIVSSENTYAEVEKIDGESFSVKLPFARAFADEKIAVVLKAAVENSPLETQTMTVTQETAVIPESGQLNGNTLTATDGNARVKSKGEYKYGEFIWKFSEVDLESGYFSINNWAGSVYLMLRFGNNDHQLSAGGEVTVNGQRVCFGFDNGWGGLWNASKQFIEGSYPADVKELRSLRLRIEPTERSGTQQNKTLSRKVWINDVLVLDNSTNVGDVWQEGSTQAGFNYLFGIESGTGTMTIESFEYKPLL